MSTEGYTMRRSIDTHQDRRAFLSTAVKARGAAGGFRALSAVRQSGSVGPHFPTSDAGWQRTWDAALDVLRGNVRTVRGYRFPVLFEGSTYQGIWQECGPHEGLVYATLQYDALGKCHIADPVSGETTPAQAARNNHMAFFSLQRPDGQ